MDGARRAALDRLGQIPARQAAVERAEHALVATAREHGASWAEIAAATGSGSRQGAEQRFRRLSRRVERSGGPGEPTLAGQGAADPHAADPHAVDPHAEGPGLAAGSGAAGAGGPAPGAGARPHLTAAGRSERARETRLRLLESTGQILAERGYASARISEIAARADLRPGSVYHHFRSKDDLIEEVLRFGVITVHRRVHSALAALPDGATPRARLAAGIGAHLEAMIELGAVGRAHSHAFAQLPRPMRQRIRPYRRGYEALWSELVGAAIESGVLRADLDRYLIRLFVVNSVEAASVWAWRAHRTPTELAAAISRLVLEGAAPHSSPESSPLPSPPRVPSST